jgi:hypothetical protein
MILNPENFMQKVKKVPISGCWIWMGAGNEKKYGTIHLTKWHSIQAHRASYMMFKGPINKGLYVCHKCDVPACVNPDHLFLGTSGDNAKDMVAKNRHAKHCKHKKRPELEVSEEVYEKVMKLINAKK